MRTIEEIDSEMDSIVDKAKMYSRKVDAFNQSVQKLEAGSISPETRWLFRQFMGMLKTASQLPPTRAQNGVALDLLEQLTYAAKCLIRLDLPGAQNLYDLAFGMASDFVHMIRLENEKNMLMDDTGPTSTTTLQ
jgi:hypothetical protein